MLIGNRRSQPQILSGAPPCRGSNQASRRRPLRIFKKKWPSSRARVEASGLASLAPRSVGQSSARDCATAPSIDRQSEAAAAGRALDRGGDSQLTLEQPPSLPVQVVVAGRRFDCTACGAAEVGRRHRSSLGRRTTRWRASRPAMQASTAWAIAAISVLSKKLSGGTVDPHNPGRSIVAGIYVAHVRRLLRDLDPATRSAPLPLANTPVAFQSGWPLRRKDKRPYR